jgi:hypothetical protein
VGTIWAGFMWLSMADTCANDNEALVSVKDVEFIDYLIIGFPRTPLNEVSFICCLCYICTFSSLTDPPHVTAVVEVRSLH